MLWKQLYIQSLSELLSRYQFELFVTVSLGIRYDPKLLEAKLRLVLKKVTRTPYHCGFYGIYTDYCSPHVHLLLTSAGEPLDQARVHRILSTAFRKKDDSTPYKQTDYGKDKDFDFSPNVERHFSSSVDVRPIERLDGVVRYLCQQYPEMHMHTYNEVFGNLKAMKKRRRDLSTAWGQLEPG